MPQPLTLAATVDQATVAVEVSSQRIIEWTVTAPDSTQRHDRAPLNLAIVVDRSGSMQGNKLRYVRQAACHVLDLLDERDRASVVVYDDTVQTLAPSTSITQQHRETLKVQIEGIRPGGTTDLSGGWFAGCQEVAAQIDDRGINRALLLTDGLANRGITDSEALAVHARELRKRGVSTSTFGVGLDFNEHLLEALAEQGGGHFFYIEQPEQIPDVFKRELGELLSVVAREAVLSISIPPGVAAEVLGDLPHEREHDRLRVFLGDLSNGETRTIYTRVLTPPDAPGTSVALRGELSYADLDGGAVRVESSTSLRYAPQVEVLRLPVQTELQERASVAEMAAAAKQALRLERAGQRVEAQALLRARMAAAPAMAAPAAAAYSQLADTLGEGMSEAQRKQAHFEAYNARQGRRGER